ncbi:AbrB family transcriptional regulator [Opitutaceae bacterium TAV4]|nr:AbrB family transcriptional regulator [Opitutaceae bacterium TAV4]RRJ98772.1 AbrB family transcriptional regulator [Opitutaceae bacterium TAV3]
MNLTLRLRKVGNSYGVILPKEALGYFNVKEGDTLSLTNGIDGSGRLAVSNREMNRQMAIVDDVMRRYRHTLKELAK